MTNNQKTIFYNFIAAVSGVFIFYLVNRFMSGGECSFGSYFFTAMGVFVGFCIYDIVKKTNWEEKGL